MVRQFSVTVHIHKRIQLNCSFSSWSTTSCRHWGRSKWCRVQRSPWWRGETPTSAGMRLLPPYHSYLHVSIKTTMKMVILPILYYYYTIIYSTWPLARITSLTWRPCSTKRLLSHHRASGLVVDVKVASRLSEHAHRLLDVVTITGKNGAGQTIGRCGVNLEWDGYRNISRN